MQEVLQVTESALDRHHLDQEAPAAQHDRRRLRVVKSELRSQGQTDEEQRDARMQLCHVPERDRDPFGARSAGVRAGAGDDRADESDQAECGQLQSCQVDEVASDDGLGGVGSLQDRW